LDLQTFCRDVLDVKGGLTEVNEYALMETALPAELASFLGVPEYATLAFHPEVAEENPGSHLVTFGSPILHNLVQLGISIGRIRKKVASQTSRFTPQTTLEAVRSALTFVRCRPPVLKHSAVKVHKLAVFAFRVVYLSDEKQDEIINVGVDMSTLRDMTRYLTSYENVFFTADESLLADYPVVPCQDYRAAYEKAKEYLIPTLKSRLKQHQQRLADLCTGELTKLLSYYNEVINDLERRADRTNANDRYESLRAKISSSKAEMEKRVDNIVGKYTVSASVELDTVALYMIPKASVALEAQHGRDFYPLQVLYNLATNQIEPPACPVCGQPFTVAYPVPGKGFVCSEECQVQEVS